MDFTELQRKFYDKWEQPKVRYGVVGFVLITIMIIIATNTEDMDVSGGTEIVDGQVVEKKKRKKVEANFFSQNGADGIERERMDEVYTLMEAQMQEREKDIDQRETNAKQMEANLMQEIEALKFSHTDLQRQIEIQKKANKDLQSQAVVANPPASNTQQPMSNTNNTPIAPVAPQVPMNTALERVAPPKVVDRKRVGIRTINSKGDKFLDSQGNISDIGPKKEVEEKEPVAVIEPEKAEPREMFLPAGSIISGVLITGMDVPTSNSAAQDPFPAMLRIKQEALLPNNFTADIRECVIVASGIGSLATGRAYLRSEAISCVTDEGKAVEANLNAFAVGADGRNGVAGKLVSKNGEAALKSAWAGFLSGMANLAGTATFSVGDDETGVFSAFESGDAMGSLAGTAALQGAGNAMEKLADYYVEIADQMKPYIEIHPGISIDFVIQRGTSIRLE